MVLKCHVNLLDGSEAEFEVGKNAKASTLFNMACEHINLIEKDYFGLIYKGSPLQRAWLNLEKKMKKQVTKQAKLDFDFAVKFYPTDPTQLREEITRYQICLQIRQDLGSNLECSVDKLTHLIAHWLQSEYEGKNDNPTAVKECLEGFKISSTETSSAEFTDRVLSLYRAGAGMNSSDADSQFLATAAGLRPYGVHFYNGKETSGNKILIGISSKGVVEKRQDQPPVSHSWSKIKNIVYKKRKFKMKLIRAPVNGDPRLKKSFIFESEDQVQLIWKNAVDHHIFFRVGDKDKKASTESGKKPKGSILRRLSSRKKKPKTELDVQDESKGITRHPPNVTRASSLRRSASLQRSVSSESSLAKDRDSIFETDKKEEGETYFVSKEPQMDSENSSIKSEDTKPLKVESEEPEHIYSQIQDKRPPVSEDDQKTYEDEDVADELTSKFDGSASGGSATLLFTETIIEEDEEDTAESAYKSTMLVQYELLRDDTGPMFEQPVELPIRTSVKQNNRPIETDVDAEVLLSPTPKDPSEFTDDIDGYTEEWDNLQVKEANHPKKDVRFYTDEPNDNDVSDKLPEEHVRKSSSSSEGEVQFHSSNIQALHPIEQVDGSLQASPSEFHSQSTTQPPTSTEEQFYTIKEYVPKARKESTEDDTWDEYENDSVDVAPLTTENDDEATHKEENHTNDASILREIQDDSTPTAEDLKDSQPMKMAQEGEYADNEGDVGRDVGHDDKNVTEKSNSADADNGSTGPKSSQSSPVLVARNKESRYRQSARSLGIDFRIGDVYKQIPSAKNHEKIHDGAASTTAATIGDEDDLAMQELDEDLMYGDGYPNGGHEEEDEAKESEHSDDETDHKISPEVIFKGESVRPPVESYKQEIPPKTQYRTHDGPASTTAATIGDEDELSMEELDDDIMYEERSVQAPTESKVEEMVDDTDDERQKQNEFIPPLDSVSRSTSLSDITDNTDELLETNALEKAWSQGAGLDEDDEFFKILFRTPPRRRKYRNRSEINQSEVRKGKQQAMAFRNLVPEEPVSPRRRENLGKRPFIPSWPFDPMSLLDSTELDGLDKDAIEAAMEAQRKLIDEDRRLEDMEMMDEEASTSGGDNGRTTTTPENEHPDIHMSPRDETLTEKLRARSRSPSASPRMVGEEFIPGVPDFVHSVIPFQLTTPPDSKKTMSDMISPMSREEQPSELESDKFPRSILKSADPLSNEQSSEGRYPSQKEIVLSTPQTPTEEEKCNPDVGHPLTSSGRSTPTGINSLSEGTNSSTSKSSGSSFPRFVHSVFPLRKPSDDRRGRSKTRRKREKKITKHKNKRVARSKSNDKKSVKKNCPTIEVTSPPPIESFKGYRILPYPPLYSEIVQTADSDKEVGNLVKDSIEKQGESARGYDQESLDKITLSDTDEAHVKPDTPKVARRMD